MPFHLYINDCHDERQVCVQTQSSLVQLKGLSYKESNSKWSVVQPHRALPNHGSGLSLKVDFYYPTIFMCINKRAMMYERLHTDIKVEWGSTFEFMHDLSPLFYLCAKNLHHHPRKYFTTIKIWGGGGGLPPATMNMKFGYFQGKQKEKN